MTDRKETHQRDELPHYDHPSGGWGSLKSVAKHMGQERPDAGVLETLMRQNKPGGHMCTSCAWTKPPNPHVAEFCENGAKATIWDLTRDRCGPEFFARHTVSELRTWPDYDLEIQGRLTHPMRYDSATDKYVEASWDEAFSAIGAKLREIRAKDPKSVVFYASGRASLETSYLYALFARLYGNNNLPDSSNMCHETTSVGLKKVTGSPVGTCVLSDFDHCDMIIFMGQNTGTNSPRFLHPLRAAKKRGCKIVTFNPVREAGLVTFRDPQNPVEMLTGKETVISDRYLQLKPGSDVAALAGMCKRVFEIDDEQGGGVIDRQFIAQHTSGWPEFEAAIRAMEWSEIERVSGLRHADLAEVGEMYANSEKVIGIYGMGLTQHVHGSLNIAMYVNLLLMRGNIGREGAGISPVRGHSNVQGQRTVGISEKPKLVPLDKIDEMFGFKSPREEGTTTVDAVQGVLDGAVKGFVSLGGNFARAVPDQGRSDPAWQNLDINVQIATKLNRSHTLVGKEAWLLPCIVRSELDMQATGPQAVSMEDSLSMIHGSEGKREPASKMLRSEPFIVAGIAKATLEPNPKVKWDDWVGDYALVRDLIEETYPDKFERFNERLFQPGGFYKGNPARERTWKTETGKAIFTAPETLSALGQVPGEDSYTLVTVRSNDQFNTTIYGFNDRLRGLETDRQVVMMNPEMIAKAGLSEGQEVTLSCAVEDGETREVGGLRVVAYDLPDDMVMAYYPETNPLVPLDYHDEMSKTPAYKGVPVRIRG
ncbi:FdhF/YdeP family oxidoreductase [Limimaricola litoreus]|uniref:FdhF/YdeP family oxidoreductase n=1 Tax=Limimaricola litoreus TaxID=2955316 RepID=A0A9X2JR32_9RHOB|nr:FdhF/YdeP family oxidoreductase [Limimaricola litoreus]MCP1169995.1 FdhF/YdeP family oxidoreductase [Limimaricola litoreus]